MLLTDAWLRMVWKEAGGATDVAPEFRVPVDIPPDGEWHLISITGGCDCAEAEELQVELVVQWKRNLEHSDLRALKIDDANIEYIDAGRDTDADGLPDWWERLHFGGDTAADPANDPDGDGMNNYCEWRAGSDPRDAGSCLDFVRCKALDNGYLLRWRSAPGRRYSILRAKTLTSGFTIIAPDIRATPPLNVFTDRYEGTPVFYRVKVSD